MVRPLRHAVDVTAAAASLALILWLLAMVEHLEAMFQVTLAAMAVLYVLVYVISGPMARVMSMPFAFRLDQNRGRRAFAMQAVTYASYHTRLLAHITHIGFAADAVAWTVLLFLTLGWWGVALLALVKIAQILSYGSRRLAVLLAGSWSAVGLLAWATVQYLDHAGATAMLAVIASGLWRVVGHATEPIPPGVSGSHRFVPLEDMGLSPTLGASAGVGFVAETASGLPFRLFDVWVFDVAARLFGFTDDHLLPRSEIDRQRAAIFEAGWVPPLPPPICSPSMPHRRALRPARPHFPPIPTVGMRLRSPTNSSRDGSIPPPSAETTWSCSVRWEGPRWSWRHTVRTSVPISAWKGASSASRSSARSTASASTPPAPACPPGTAPNRHGV